MFPNDNDEKSWVLFIEIKDCKGSRIYKYKQDVKDKLILNVEEFRRKGILLYNRVYGVASFPRKKTAFNEMIVSDPTEYKTFYKERWICEEISESARKRGEKPLEQHLIVSFSLKYRNYQRKIRQGQIERADKLIQSGQYKRNRKNQNHPHRFIRI